MYSQARLVDVATPDFSMPYNVTMMTCTLLAVLFGNVLKLLTRRWVRVEVGEQQDRKDVAKDGAGSGEAGEAKEIIATSTR